MCDTNREMQVKNSTTKTNIDHNKDGLEKCKVWLENHTGCDDFSLDGSGQADDDGSFDCSSTTYSDYSEVVSRLDTLTTTNNPNFIGNTQLEGIFGKNQNVYENILINNSKKVHLGNVTVINGPIYIKEAKKLQKLDEDDENDEMPEHLKAAEAKIRWIDRRAWLSQPPLEEYEKLNNPAKFVIICQSATEDATSHADNIMIVRYIQQFHIECRKWADIAYNFLIGCDGYTYKGRGWGIRGTQSFRYNKISVGICFVGTFCTKLPTQIALAQAKALIRYGVRHCEIDKDYCLIGNCQVSSSKSPRKYLYEEIKTWDHFDSTVSLENPSPLIDDIS